MEQNQIREQIHPVLVWIIASILLHLLIMLVIMTYKFHTTTHSQLPLPKQQEQYVMWSTPQPKQQAITPQMQMPKQQPAPQAQQAVAQKQAAQPQPKEEEKPLDLEKLPIIMPGKAGIDHQDLDGTPQASQEKMDTDEKETKQQEPIAPPMPKETPQQEAPQQKQSKPSDIDSRQQAIPKPKPTSFVAEGKPLPSPSKKTEAPQHPNTSSDASNPYRYVPTLRQEIPVKSISFKDIGLGFDDRHLTFGNSAHMGIAGNSPDIATGDELRYVTYLNQMANMIVNSLNTNSNKHWMTRYTGEPIMVHIKVDRKGNLLESRMVQASKAQGINDYILDSMKQVGLFNPLPKFIKKDTFEISWTIKFR